MQREPLAGPYGGIDDENIPRFRDSAANAAWFHGFNEQMFEKIESTGKAPCVEYKTFRADFSAHPDLVPIGSDGEPIRYGRLVQGVCLSKDWFVRERIEELRKGMETFRPAGVWLDYLTYAGWFETPEPDLQESCFCDDCIADFCESTGVDADTPERILSQYQSEWTQRKITRIAEYAETFSEIIKSHDREFIPESRRMQLILDYLDYPFSLRELTRAQDPGWGVQVFGGNQIFSSPDSAKTFNDCVSAILTSWTAEG